VVLAHMHVRIITSLAALPNWALIKSKLTAPLISCLVPDTLLQ